MTQSTPYAGPSHAELAAAHRRILNAREIPLRHLQHDGRTPIDVVARIVWENDGEDRISTRAIDWVGRDVLVEISDRRWQTKGVWLDASDVRRR